MASSRGEKDHANPPSKVATLISIAKRVRDKATYLQSQTNRDGMTTLLDSIEPHLAESLKGNPALPTLGPYLDLYMNLLM